MCVQPYSVYILHFKIWLWLWTNSTVIIIKALCTRLSSCNTTLNSMAAINKLFLLYMCHRYCLIVLERTAALHRQPVSLYVSGHRSYTTTNTSPASRSWLNTWSAAALWAPTQLQHSQSLLLPREMTGISYRIIKVINTLKAPAMSEPCHIIHWLQWFWI